ncbi:MAG: phosphate ABC transporter substrate-binding protein [Mesorhizobium amorphae]|nr:MAG: phosphate ABC transporter substrate-binding protein [Mesorhizobium amorphae]
MTRLVAALPMYDWPETRAETDALWVDLRDRMRKSGIPAPDSIVHRDADLPDAGPSASQDLDLQALWRRPDLLFAQTCWGPMGMGVAAHVAVLGQPDYSPFAGGDGPRYSSAILMRKGEGEAVEPPRSRDASLPLERLCGARFAFNGPDSMSGVLGLENDLEAAGEGLGVFEEALVTGSHRASIRAVAAGEADICAIDCRSWALALDHEPAARDLVVVGWTGKRLGLPYVASRHLPETTLDAVRDVLREAGAVVD